MGGNARGRREGSIADTAALERILKHVALGLAAYLLAAGTWAIAVPAGSRPLAAAASDAAVRAAPEARFRALAALDADVTVRLVVDGVAVAADARPGATVADLLDAAGVRLGPADRLSVPADTPVVPGLRVVLDRGFPVTLLDGGRAYALRSRPGTVADFLALSGISIAPGDRLVTPADAVVEPGGTVEIERVAESERTEEVVEPHAVLFVYEPDQLQGWQQVEVAGRDGTARVTYLVRVVNGVEQERTTVASVELVPAIAEVRHVGTRPRPAPPAPAEIAAIIRAAAARYGVDAEQLLRVAWCESRYDPNAYNGVLGASGLFQIIPGTWAANSVRAGYGGASAFDPVANANVAAWMFAHGAAGLWVCR